MPAAIATLIALSRLGPQSGLTAKAITTVLGFTLMLTSALLVFRRWLLRFRRPRSMPNARRDRAALTIPIGAVIGLLVSVSSVGAGAIGVTALLLLYPTYSTARIVGTDIAHAVPLTLVAGTGHWLTGCVDALVPAYGINSRNRTWQLPGAPHPRAGFAISLGHRSHGRWNQTDLVLATYYELREDPVQAHLRDGRGRGRGQPHRGPGQPQRTPNPARFQLINESNSQGSGALLSSDTAHF